MTKMNAAYLKQRLSLISKEIIRIHKYRSSVSDEDVVDRYFNVVLPARRTGRKDLPDDNLEATLILMNEYLEKEIP